MVFSRGLVISLGVSALSATLLFLYFRNRITSVEKKVDLMFDLIQTHESDRKQMAQQHMMSRQSAPIPQTNGAWREEQSHERDLIDVSEDEEYDSEDSKEVSDDEDDLEERIKLVTSDIDLEETEEEKNIVVLEPNQNETIIIDDTVELQEVTDDVDQGSSGDNENTIQSVTNADEPDELSEVDDSLEDNDTDEEEDEEQDVEEEVSHNVEYNKLKVTELKALAEAKGLTNYKSLKKQPLIDLIRASE
tara:strand:+ start:1985 stop:2728 length:744 start_codon:yes stop_codon:yes gene_type:complete